jgi:hypothetical protein
MEYGLGPEKTYPESRGQKSTGSRIRISCTAKKLGLDEKVNIY